MSDNFSVLYKEIQSRLSAVVAVGQLEKSRAPEQFAARVMPQFGGKESLFGTWIFASSASATVAADELYRLSKEDLVIVVLTGESEAAGPSRGMLSARAKEACHAIERPGVYACPATQLVAADVLPADLWFLDVGPVQIESGGVEHLYALCKGEEDPGLIQAFPKGSQVPRPPNSFLGREDDLQKVAQILSQWFLVTIAGLPGAGKSVFAMVLAIAMGDDFPGGVFWIDVSRCRNADELVRKLQRTTSHGRSKRMEPLHVMANRLASQHALIVFDNADGLVDELREITEALLCQTTRLTVLVTSSIALRTSREHMYVLGPLTLPKQGEEYKIFKDFNSDAVGLFAERAQAVREDFTLATDNVETVADICRALGGNPLAIEIAASKMAGRTLQSLERQLAKLLTLRNDTPLRAHQNSVKQAMMRAVTTMPPDQVQLLKGLCLFDGPFTLEWAEVIWTEDPEDGALDETLSQLVRRSLLAFDGETGQYEVPALVRLLVTSQPDYQADVHDAKHRYCRYMFDVAVRGRQLFDDNREEDALRLLDPHYTEIKAAIKYGCGLPEIRADVPRLLLTLPHYWAHRNLLINCDQLVSFVMKAAEATQNEQAQMLVLLGAAQMVGHNYEASRKYYLEAARLSQDRVILLRVHGNLGLIESYLGYFESSYGHLEKALGLALEDGDRARISSISLTWADVLGQWVDTAPPANARELLDKADSLVKLARTRLGEDPANYWQDQINNVEALLAWCRGDTGNAWKFYVLAALAAEANKCEAEAALGLERLALICIREKRYQDAAKFAGLAVQIRVSRDRPRKPIDQERFDEMMLALSKNLGVTRVGEYCDYGASLTISDLCVLT